MGKLSKEEIIIAGRLVYDIYFSDGYDAAKKTADKLQARMILEDSVSPENIEAFEKSTGFFYRK